MERLNAFFWFLAIILAIVFLTVGFVLLLNSPSGKKRLGWAENVPRGVSVSVGAIMIVGALCLVIPALIPGLAWLAPVAAFILAMLMLGTAQSYLAKHDSEGAAVYILLLVMLGVLAFGRWPWLAASFG